MYYCLDSGYIIEGLNMRNGVDLVKDTTPYVAVSTGGALTLSPALILQIVGVVVGIGGFIMAFFRWKEAKRANDLNERKWEYEIASGKDKAQTEENPSKE